MRNHNSFWLVFSAILVSSLQAQPTTDLNVGDFNVREMKTLCSKDDTMACIQYRVYKYLHNVIDKDTFNILDDIQVKRNSYRSSKSVPENSLEKYLDEHDITIKLPFTDSSVNVSGRDFTDQIDTQVEGRKSKLKKILVPILVFVLLKAMTFVPLALGVLGLKAWNALQLAFFSFVTSLALAIFQLCKKIAADNTAAYAAHTAWDPNYKRSLNEINDNVPEQQLAYKAYHL